MQFINETLKTPVRGDYDVVVVGGGPSGCAAAIAAARRGASVLLVEKNQCLGGMWTSGLVNPLFDHANKTGILKEIIDTLKKNDCWGGFWDESFNYEYMKKILEDMCADAGVTVLYDTRYVGAICDDGRIGGIIVHNIEGRAAYTAKVVVDACADAAVAADCGVKFDVGENGDYKKCQAMTLMYLVGNVPEKYKDGVMLNEMLQAAYEKDGSGKKPPFTMPYLIPMPNSNVAVIQLTHMRGKNPLCARDLTDAITEGRQQVIETFEMLKKHDEDFKDLILITSAPMLGVRESRRIDGEYTLTVDDLINGEKPHDSVAVATFNIDIHNNDDEHQNCKRVSPYGIPLRCMMPKGVDGLAVVGKTISGSHEAMASYRVTGNCVAMGEAVGKAAAVAVHTGKEIRAVGIDEISD